MAEPIALITGLSRSERTSRDCAQKESEVTCHEFLVAMEVVDCKVVAVADNHPVLCSLCVVEERFDAGLSYGAC